MRLEGLSCCSMCGCAPPWITLELLDVSEEAPTRVEDDDGHDDDER